MGWLEDLTNNHVSSGTSKRPAHIGGFGNSLGGDFGNSNPFRGMAQRNPWIGQALPQFGGSQRKPWEVGFGGYNADFSDPRMLASLALIPATCGLSTAYVAGRDIENQRRDKQLEREYAPRAEANANRARQAATYGGLTGGIGDANARDAFQQIMQLLADEKRKYRGEQAGQEMQAISMLAQLFGYGVGGPMGGAVGGAGAGAVAPYYGSAFQPR